MEKKYTQQAYSAAIEELLKASPSFGTVGAAAYKPGLERSLEMDLRLGTPSAAFRSIHVAGTNGKGSVCNFLASALASHGKKVGLYTSPHISDFRERIRIVQGGTFSLVPQEWVYDFLCRFGPDMSGLGLSFFEMTTAMCFAYFAGQRVDYAVIETGLGGLYDATNIIIPELSVITNIGLDHMDILGDTLEKIARQKAGIIKPGVPVVVGEYDALTAPVFEKAAMKAGSRLLFADRQSTPPLPELPQMDLQGSYQEKNLRTATCALRCLGMEPVPEAIGRAAHICGFRARWEKISDNPLIICDIGHNAHGLKYNFAQLSAMLESGEVSDVIVVYGSVKDKDVDASIALMPARARVIFTSAGNPRAMDTKTLFSKYSALFPSRTAPDAYPFVADAVTAALLGCVGLKKPLVYIGGSTYVVGEALRLLERPEGGRCRVMGIVNLTPDSFLAASRADSGDMEALVARVAGLLADGADIIDVGACSTAPGNEPVDSQEEWRRLEAPLAALFAAFPDTVFSIDSFRPEIIRKVLALKGNTENLIVNDVRSCEMNGEMLRLVADRGLEYIAMDSSDDPLGFFARFSACADAFGVKKWILDPGFGFGKSVGKNWEILRSLPAFRRFGRPILVALSRKRMIWTPAGLTPDSCEQQSVRAERLAVLLGADIVRTHDVRDFDHDGLGVI